MNHDPGSEGRTLASSYRTGHRPKESIAQLLARVNANSSIGEVQVPPKAAKKHRIVKAAEQLTPGQLKLVLELVRGERAMISHAREQFAVKRVEGGWSIHGLHAIADEHTVIDGACSCEDFRFRKRECKHIQALKVLQ